MAIKLLEDTATDLRFPFGDYREVEGNYGPQFMLHRRDWHRAHGPALRLPGPASCAAARRRRSGLGVPDHGHAGRAAAADLGRRAGRARPGAGGGRRRHAGPGQLGAGCVAVAAGAARRGPSAAAGQRQWPPPPAAGRRR
jgi:hypothetical protein